MTEPASSTSAPAGSTSVTSGLLSGSPAEAAVDSGAPTTHVLVERKYKAPNLNSKDQWSNWSYDLKLIIINIFNFCWVMFLDIVKSGIDDAHEKIQSCAQLKKDLLELGQKLAGAISGPAKELLVAADATTVWDIYRTLFSSFGSAGEVEMQRLFEGTKNETFQGYINGNPHLTSKNSQSQCIRLWANSLNARLGKLRSYLPTEEARSLFIRDRLMNALSSNYGPIVTQIRASGANPGWKQLVNQLCDWATAQENAPKTETSGGTASSSSSSSTPNTTGTVMLTQAEADKATKKAIKAEFKAYFAKGKKGGKSKGKHYTSSKNNAKNNYSKHGGKNNNSNNWSGGWQKSGGNNWGNQNSYSGSKNNNNAGPYDNNNDDAYVLVCATCGKQGHSSAFCYSGKGGKGKSSSKPVRVK